jgi:hypothetical protein
VVPVVGDVFDVVWKASLKNVALLERHHAEPERSRRADRRFIVLLCGSLLLLCGALAAAGVFLLAAVMRLLSGH